MILGTTNKKIKIIINKDDQLEGKVREELVRVLKNHSNLRTRLKYIMAVHQEKVVATDLRINKDA